MRMSTLSLAAKALSFSAAIQQRFGRHERSIQLSTDELVELPGDTPFSLCPVSRSTDLFDIRYLELTQQPVYMGVIA